MDIEQTSIAGPIFWRHARACIREDSLVFIMEIEVAVGTAPAGASLASGCDLPVGFVGGRTFEVGV